MKFDHGRWETEEEEVSDENRSRQNRKVEGGEGSRPRRFQKRGEEGNRRQIRRRGEDRRRYRFCEKGERTRRNFVKGGGRKCESGEDEERRGRSGADGGGHSLKHNVALVLLSLSYHGPIEDRKPHTHTHTHTHTFDFTVTVKSSWE